MLIGIEAQILTLVGFVCSVSWLRASAAAGADMHQGVRQFFPRCLQMIDTWTPKAWKIRLFFALCACVGPFFYDCLALRVSLCRSYDSLGGSLRVHTSWAPAKSVGKGSGLNDIPFLNLVSTPEGPSTRYLRLLVPKRGTHDLKYWVPGPSGHILKLVTS